MFAFIFARRCIVCAAAQERNGAAVAVSGFRGDDFFDGVAGDGFTVVVDFFQGLVELADGHVCQLGVRVRRIRAPVAVQRTAVRFRRHQDFIVGTEDFARVDFAARRQEDADFTRRVAVAVRRRDDVEVVIGEDFTVVGISTVRILLSRCEMSAVVAVAGIDVGTVVVFDHVVERRRCGSAAGIRRADIRAARDIIEVDAGQRRNTCRFDHDLIRFQKAFIAGCRVGIGLVSLDDVVFSGAGIAFVCFVLNGIAVADPVGFTRAVNRFFVIGITVKSPTAAVCTCSARIISVCIVAVVDENGYILARRSRTGIGCIRRSQASGQGQTAAKSEDGQSRFCLFQTRCMMMRNTMLTRTRRDKFRTYDVAIANRIPYYLINLIHK